jgi:hypothetical protein
MLKSVFRRLRKGIRDIGSFAQDNPLITAGAAAFGLPTLFGGTGGGGGGFNLFDLIRTGIGSLDKTITSPTAKSVIEGSGLLGGIQDIYQDLSGKDKAGIGLGLLNTYLAKRQFDEEKAEELRREEEMRRRYMLVSDKFGSELGGTPFVKEMIRGTVYDPKTDKTYDYYDRATDTYGYFQEDDEGKIVTSASGGIAQLNVGGHPRNTMSFTIPARRATGGIMDEMISEQIFDPRMSGNQMMNEIEKNPGITEFFPPKFGMIEGPGGPKDDKIPAMLSDGEFVMTAKAVDNAGGPKAMYGLMNALDPESSKGKGII